MEVSESEPEQPRGPPEADGGEAKSCLKPQIERTRVKEKIDVSLAAGDVWYPVSYRWYQQWAEYTAFEENDAVEDELDKLHLRDVPRPPAIENAHLVGDNPKVLKKGLVEKEDFILVPSAVWDLWQKWYGGGPAFPRQVTTIGGVVSEERVDLYPLIIKAVWASPETGEPLADPEKVEWVTFRRDHPLLRFLNKRAKQYVKEEGIPEKDIQAARNPGSKGRHGEFYDVLLRCWMKYPPGDWEGPISRLDSTDSDDEGEEAGESSLDHEAFSPGADTSGHKWRLIRHADDDTMQQMTPENLGWTEKTEILLERRPNNGVIDSTTKKKQPWKRYGYRENWRDFHIGDILDVKDKYGKWYESRIDQIRGEDGAKEMRIHSIGWAAKYDEWVPFSETDTRIAKINTHTNDPKVFRRGSLVTTPATNSTSRPSTSTRSYSYQGGGSTYSWSSNSEGTPLAPGIVGLKNLGNTCFMNSTLQCLTQAPGIKEYFASGQYVKDINKDNVLGWKGKVARAWGDLQKDMWSGKYTVVGPRDFKRAIGEVAPQFLGYQQQDSSELLAFLLDGLHEDLNLVKKKPPTEAVEANGRPDAEVATEAWATHLLRNRSIIVDRMQGQFKSTVRCPDCSRLSVTFDPFLYLQVPLPIQKKKRQLLSVVFADPSKRILKCAPEVKKLGSMRHLKQKIAELVGNIDPGRLVLCDVWNHRIYKPLKEDTMCSDIRSSDTIFAYEVPAIQNAGDAEPEALEQEEGETGSSYYRSSMSSRLRENKNNPGGVYVQVVNFAQVRNRSYYPGSSYSREYTNEAVGIPLVTNLPMHRPLTCNDVIAQLWELVRPFTTEEFRAGHQPPFRVVLYNQEGRSRMDGRYTDDHQYLEPSDDPFDHNKGQLAFGLHWPENALDAELMEKVDMHDSVPQVGSSNRERSAETISLSQCLDCFTEAETLSEADAWYCSNCKEHKCASKKFDIWKLPDVLVIHLKRFAYTRHYRDKISTNVDYPLEGLDLSPWIVNAHHDPSLYDLFAVSNHMGGMGGGHYTAYAKHVDNDRWYSLDDSHTSEISNPEQVKGPASYVLYYKRRNGSSTASTPQADITRSPVTRHSPETGLDDLD